MTKVTVEKDIHVRDKYNVRRRVYVAGQQVEKNAYEAVLRANTVLNPDDLPTETPRAMETKTLPERTQEDSKSQKGEEGAAVAGAPADEAKMEEAESVIEDTDDVEETSSKAPKGKSKK